MTNNSNINNTTPQPTKPKTTTRSGTKTDKTKSGKSNPSTPSNTMVSRSKRQSPTPSKRQEPTPSKRQKLTRTNRVTIVLNDSELRILERYCQRYTVTNRSRLIRETLMREVLKRLDMDSPTLFD